MKLYVSGRLYFLQNKPDLRWAMQSYEDTALNVLPTFDLQVVFCILSCMRQRHYNIFFHIPVRRKYVYEDTM